MSLKESNCHFDTVGIIGKYGDGDLSDTILLVLEVIDDFGANAIIDKNTISNCILNNTRHSTADIETLTKNSDLIITVGGDGTFLASSRSIIERGTPIIGVNMGRLGFLTDISPNEIKADLYDILNGKYLYEARTVLFSKVIRNGKSIISNVGINDIVIHKKSVSRMVELDVYINNRFLSSYLADGLIVSSPTGSTAYALSSGGPILQGNLDALVLVPICPHTLTQRPIVIDAKSEQRIEIPDNNNDNIQITVDGQKEIPLCAGDQVFITGHSKKLHIYHPFDYDYLKRLRRKLNWGSETKEN